VGVKTQRGSNHRLALLETESNGCEHPVREKEETEVAADRKLKNPSGSAEKRKSERFGQTRLEALMHP